MKIARVALDVPLDTLFDYLPGAAGAADIGRRVRVPFGSKQALGVLVAFAAESELPAARLKPIAAVLRDAPPLPRRLLDLFAFCARYYQHPLGPTVIGALPTRLRRAQPLPAKAPAAYRATAAGAKLKPEDLPPRKLVQRRLWRLLAERGELTRPAALAVSPGAPRALAELSASGLIEPSEPAAPPIPAAAAAPVLTDEQERAVTAIAAGLGGFAAWLLQGVTGSGKTEVYLRVIAQVLESGGQALVLVPEISLTPQLEARFRSRFPAVRIVSLHSGLAESERLEHWLAAHSGRAAIVLGTRLGVFAPLPRLGIIIVDEEQDGSFKQQDGLRYSARDVAVFRAKHEGVPVLLGSATPSLESLYNARRGRYRLLRLTRRAVGGAELPRVRIIDTRALTLAEGLSPPLIEALRERLARREQSLVFINRRGYAPVLMCPGCRWTSACSRCASHLVLHLRERRLLCHHCGHGEPVPAACPGCGNQDLRPVGHGTQRVEAALAALFPQARIARIDRDSLRRRQSWEGLLAAIEAGRIDILVGTQLLAKGHDIAGLSLVGVLNSDAALYATDFRAAERLAAQLWQVAGRAGRARIPGEVLVQTQFPDHPLYGALARQAQEALTDELLEERRQAAFPPFVYQALLRAEAARVEPVMAFLRQAAACAAAHAAGIEVFEPVPAAMARLAGRERGQLLVQSASRARLQQFLAGWRPQLPALAGRQVRWALDVDPLEL